MSRFIVESGFAFTQEIIRFLEETIEDWILVIPDANDFLRDCQHFLNVIEVKIPPEQKEKLLALGLKAVDERALYTASSEAAIEVARSQNQHYSEGPSPTPNETRPRSNSVRKRDRIKNWIHKPIDYYRSYRLDDTESTGSSGSRGSSEEKPVLLSPETAWQHRTAFFDMHQQGKIEYDGEIAIIREVVQRIAIAKKFLGEFLAQNDRKKTFQESVDWNIKRAQQAGDLRRYFQAESNAIRGRLNDLVLCQTIKDREAIVKLDQFKTDMAEDAYKFWNRFFGQKVRTGMREFIDAYILLFGDLEPGDQEYLERALGSKDKANREITVFGFINFTNKHGFPFGQNIASSAPELESLMSEERVMDLTKMVMELVAEFSSKEMRNHLINIYTWFDDCTTKEQRYARADEWGKLMKAIRKNKIRNPEGVYLEADNVDLARRALYFFYQRFMVMWRVGKVSRETLSGVDFPGRGRINDFIDYVGPLDRANFHIVMGKEDCVWEEGKPKVYMFLEQYLKLTGKDKEKERQSSQDSTTEDPSR